MVTVLQLNKTGVWVILISKENLCDLFLITDATFARTLVSAQTNARVAASQGLVARLGTWRSIAWLRTKLAACLVRTLPRAGLDAGSTGLATWLHTLTVFAEILTWETAGGAVPRARLPALVRTYQETVTFVKA